MDPEIRTHALFKDRFIGVERKGHALSKGKVTPSRYAKGRHISVELRGLVRDRSMKP
jgi:hypothetical protein